MIRALLISLILTSGTALAQAPDLRLPISLDAESTDYDGKSSMLMFRGLRLSQGRIGVEADRGRASKLDFKDSVWHFEGNVVIDVEDGHMESDSADLAFREHTLRTATVTGSPATFELRRPGSDEVTYAEARQLKYDLDTGIVEFSGDALITEGGNQIASSFLVYNIRERRIKAQAAEGDERVRITYTPGDSPEAEEAPADAGDPAGEATEDDAAGDESP